MELGGGPLCRSPLYSTPVSLMDVGTGALPRGFPCSWRCTTKLTIFRAKRSYCCRVLFYQDANRLPLCTSWKISLCACFPFVLRFPSPICEGRKATIWVFEYLSLSFSLALFSPPRLNDLAGRSETKNKTKRSKPLCTLQKECFLFCVQGI